MADLRDALDNAIRLGNVGGLTRKGCVTAVLPVVERYRATSRAEVEQLKARLDLPCGSCHPCTNYSDETWRKAGRKPPHVIEWDELRAAAQRVRDLHHPEEGNPGRCNYCREPWPCATDRALDGGETS